MSDYRDLLRQAQALDQADVDQRFSVEQVNFCVVVNRAQLSVGDDTYRTYLDNTLRVTMQTWFLTEHLYDRDATLRVERKIRPRWIPQRVWNRIPTETVERTYHFTVDRLYPDANPNLGRPTIKEKLEPGT